MTHSHSGHDHGDHGEHDDDEPDEMGECIELCLTCHASCTVAAQSCLGAGGERADPDLIGVLLDCAQICQTSADFMLRGSPYHAETCMACSAICRACEDSCRAAGDDEQLAQCAAICAACADSCERMAEEGDEEDAGEP